MVQNNPRSAQITALKEEGNAAFKANDFNKAIELYTVAANAASTRPLFEPSVWIREELAVVLCNRAAAYSSAKMWVEALCDAEVVIQLKRNWNKGHFRKVKALQGLGHIEEAKDAALLGLEFEPDNSVRILPSSFRSKLVLKPLLDTDIFPFVFGLSRIFKQLIKNSKLDISRADFYCLFILPSRYIYESSFFCLG
jgi:translocation protein SEC72